jgi:hypothetical protein
MRQVQQGADAVIAGQGDAPPVTVVIAERDVISRWSGPDAGL